MSFLERKFEEPILVVKSNVVFVEVSLLPMFLYAFVFGFCIFVHM